MIRFNIMAILEERKKSRYWLAKQMGMSHQNLTKLAKGQTRSVRLGTIETLCQVLECTPNDLFVIDFNQPENETGDA